jgi:hypothetical protein
MGIYLVWRYALRTVNFVPHIDDDHYLWLALQENELSGKTFDPTPYTFDNFYAQGVARRTCAAHDIFDQRGNVLPGWHPSGCKYKVAGCNDNAYSHFRNSSATSGNETSTDSASEGDVLTTGNDKNTTSQVGVNETVAKFDRSPMSGRDAKADDDDNDDGEDSQGVNGSAASLTRAQDSPPIMPPWMLPVRHGQK